MSNTKKGKYLKYIRKTYKSMWKRQKSQEKNYRKENLTDNQHTKRFSETSVIRKD